jgi:hypothetical protein
MRWEPKPYRLNGWEFQFDENTVKALPNVDELGKKISAAATELSNAIARAETTLMLQCLTDKSLEDLAALCKNELKKRKKMRDSFKIEIGNGSLLSKGKL